MYVTHNTKHIEWNNTSLQGEIKVTYKELCKLFGNPSIIHGAGSKIDAHWAIDFGGTVATIYNWKNGPNYCGAGGTPVDLITEWHVGGHNKQALDQVQIAVDLFRESSAEKSCPDFISDMNDMLDSIRAQKGTAFANSVHLATCVKRQMSMFGIVIHGAMKGNKPTDEAAEVLCEAFADVCAEILRSYCDTAGVDTEIHAEEITMWADRIANIESAGIAGFMRNRGK